MGSSRFASRSERIFAKKGRLTSLPFFVWMRLFPRLPGLTHMTLSTKKEEHLHRALDSLQIELPSWAFANTGTRFGKFLDPSAAVTIGEKLADAAQVHRFTGCCPKIAVHVLWDFPDGIQGTDRAIKLRPILACTSAPSARMRVLVDTGHHYQAQNIERIVAWLLDEKMLGGFHLNDRRYADDDF